MDEMALLQRYVESQDQDAFGQLVRQQGDWLYSSARRQLGDEHLAEDVTQAVFLLLARRAKGLTHYAYLGGWLFTTLKYCVREAKRHRVRLVQREQEAAKMRSQRVVDEADWAEISPVLDQALSGLGRRDREAVLLRFYQERSLAEVGRALGVSEEAARKRVTRALEKLRSVLAKKGVTAGVGTLGVVMTAKLTEAAPAGLVEAATAAAGGGGAGSAGIIAKGAIKMMVWAKVKVAAGVMLVLALAVGTGIVVAENLPRPAPATPASAATTQPAPGGAGMVKSNAEEGNPEVLRIRQAIQAAAQGFPARYRTVVWQQEGLDAMIDVIYRDSPKFRQSRYFSLSPQFRSAGKADYYVPAGSTTEAMLKWAEKQTAVAVALCDGEREYTRDNPVPWVKEKASPSARVRMTSAGGWMPAGFLLNWNSHPEYFQWPTAYGWNGPAEILTDAPAGCVGVRYSDQTSYRADYYLDVQHDYICVRELHWESRKSRWEREREERSLDLHRLPDGQWYAAKRTIVNYPDPEKGYDRAESTWTIDVKVLGQGEFPLDTFNGAKLVEGADVHAE